MLIGYIINEWDVAKNDRLKLLPLFMRQTQGEIQIITTGHDLQHYFLQNMFRIVPFKTTNVQETDTYYNNLENRDIQVKDLIEKTKDLKILKSKMPFYEAFAYDDFRGHMSDIKYEFDDIPFDYIFTVCPSISQQLPQSLDLFTTQALVYYKKKGVKIVMLEMYSDSNPLYKHFADAFIHKHDIPSILDRYFLSTQYSPQLQSALTTRQNRPKDRPLVITIINHFRHREALRKSLKLIKDKCPKDTVIQVIKSGFNVRNLTEDDILKRIFQHIFGEEQGRTISLASSDEVNIIKYVLDSDVTFTPYMTELLENLSIRGCEIYNIEDQIYRYKINHVLFTPEYITTIDKRGIDDVITESIQKI